MYVKYYYLFQIVKMLCFKSDGGIFAFCCFVFASLNPFVEAITNHVWFKTSVGMASVLIASLYPMIENVKTRDRIGCHVHFLVSFFLIARNCTYVSGCDFVLCS